MHGNRSNADVSDPDEQVPDELEEQLDELAETLRDPERGDRRVEDQGEEDTLDKNEPR
jgi:hypothetical protein